MIENVVVAAMAARLAHALAAPAGHYRPLRIGAHAVGWLDAVRAAMVAPFTDVFAVDGDAVTMRAELATPASRTVALDHVAAALAAAGELTAWRNERDAVAPSLRAEPLCLLERAAARFFGIHTYAVHVNGLTRGEDGIAMWIARRSPRKAIDPGMLDNLVGGGIAAGMGIAATLVKEAWEEAGIAAPLASLARGTGAVHICREQPDGLQRESIFVHDLELPAGFVPAGQDGEVDEHRLVPLAEAAALAANTGGHDVVTADASLVIVDCLFRHGLIAPDTPDYLALEALRHPDSGLR